MKNESPSPAARDNMFAMQYVLLVLVALATLVSAPAVFTQPREITEAELEKLRTEAAERRKGMPVREKKSTTGYAPGDSSETLSEFGPNATYHYKAVRRVNGVETKTEGIRIGEIRYTRRQDGTWIKELLQGKGGGGQGSGYGSGNGSGANPGPPPEIATEYLYIGSENIDGKKTAHYRKTRTVKFVSRTPVLIRIAVYDYWFRTDGLLVKEFHEDTFVNSNRSYKSTTEYEYDKDIKITAPIRD